MELKTFRAYSMAEALAAVKQQIGHDAVILNTRTFKRGGVLGIGCKVIIEVTATPAPSGSDASLSSSSNKKSDVRRPAAQRAYAAQQKIQTNGKGIKDQRERTKQLALAMAQMRHRDKGFEATDEEAIDLVLPKPAAAPVPEPEVLAPPALAPQSLTPQPIAPPRSEPLVEIKPESINALGKPQRFILQSTDQNESNQGDSPNSGSQAAALDAAIGKPTGGSENIAIMQSELGAIKDLVGQVLQRQVTTSSGRFQPSMPQQLFDMYLKLLGQELSEDLADSIINQVRDELTSEQMKDDKSVRVAVMRHLAELIPTTNETMVPRKQDGRPLTIALIGPTGVGKTTTLAKIAATFKLHQKKHVGLITADTYRIAAVDQLRTYANIIGLPLKVVLTPAEMEQAVHALRDCDVILIDTAGRSQNDKGRLDELKQFIHMADPHEVHLVLSSTTSEKVMLHEAEAFSVVGVDKVVLTKLDEAVSFGVLVNVLSQVGKSLSFVTTGQEVPDHIEAGESDRLASLVIEGKLAS
ncbi:MAG: flagellar biosynthesis protein FlhF [Planctomycetota bacterium]|nr:flagellar biosynthesis protein FlhF [Planctomycetota bacterium]